MSKEAILIKISPISEVVKKLQLGEMIVLVDRVDRENEGDIVVATEKITPEKVAFMMREARGLICVSLAQEVAERLEMPLQAANNSSPFGTAFTVTVDHRTAAALGASAAGRAHTMRSLVDENARAEDFTSPGHVFPLVAHPAGVIGRQGQTEGSADLARIAGLSPSGVICEILNRDGTMARGQTLADFVSEHGLLVTSVDEIIRYRIQHEVLLSEVVQREHETDYGRFLIRVFIDEADGKEHLALCYGNLSSANAPLVRVHSECLTGDVFQSRRCDCGPQLEQAIRQIVKAGSGVILYLRQEGRGIGLLNKLKAYSLQDEGADTVEANVQLGFSPDERDFVVAAKILNALEVNNIRLITNNPNKIETLTNAGITVQERIPVIVEGDQYSSKYLATKREKLGHLF